MPDILLHRIVLKPRSWDRPICVVDIVKSYYDTKIMSWTGEFSMFFYHFIHISSIFHTFLLHLRGSHYISTSFEPKTKSIFEKERER